MDNLFGCVRRKTWFFVFLCVLTVVSIILAMFAGFSSLDLDLWSLVYIRFLNGEVGLVSLIFGLAISILIFYAVILICNFKKVLLPIAVVFYLYLVYSQAVIWIGIFVEFGFFNVLLMAMLLFMFFILEWILFMLLMVNLFCLDEHDYFKSCFNVNVSNASIILMILLALTFVFALILSILKTYIILLVY